MMSPFSTNFSIDSTPECSFDPILSSGSVSSISSQIGRAKRRNAPSSATRTFDHFLMSKRSKVFAFNDSTADDMDCSEDEVIASPIASMKLLQPPLGNAVHVAVQSASVPPVIPTLVQHPFPSAQAMSLHVPVSHQMPHVSATAFSSSSNRPVVSCFFQPAKLKATSKDVARVTARMHVPTSCWTCQCVFSSVHLAKACSRCSRSFCNPRCVRCCENCGAVVCGVCSSVDYSQTFDRVLCITCYC